MKTAKFFTIVADEVESHQVEQLTLWIRFVDDKKNICEVFLGFGKSTRVTCEVIAYEIIHINKAWLDIKDYFGQAICHQRL